MFEKFNIKNNDKNIVIVGAIPSPIGGVSTYLYRYVLKNHDNIDKFFDLYYDDSKYTLPKDIKYFLTPKNKLFSAFWIFGKMCSTKDKKVFFNFSTSKALLLLLLLPKRNNYWILMLHHGELREKFNQYSPVMKKMIKAVIKKFDEIQYISDSQLAFYKTFNNINKVSIKKTSTYVAVDPKNIQENAFPVKLQKFINTYDVKLIMSGYPRELYRYDLLVDYLIGKKLDNICLVICLYGEEEKEYMDLIKDKIKGLGYIKLVYNLDMYEFLSLLSQSDIYIRTNNIDSFGIAVADAVTLGLDVLASDICIRYEGTKLFRTDNIADFENNMDALLEKYND